MSTRYQLILCTCPDKRTAENIARQLVNDKLAACVNILPGMTSVYTWKEQTEAAEEHLLLIKANKACYQAIEKKIRKQHPYELPEIIAVPIENGLPEYLHWIDSCHF